MRGDWARGMRERETLTLTFIHRMTLGMTLGIVKLSMNVPTRPAGRNEGRPKKGVCQERKERHRSIKERNTEGRKEGRKGYLHHPPPHHWGGTTRGARVDFYPYLTRLRRHHGLRKEGRKGGEGGGGDGGDGGEDRQGQALTKGSQ
jgi:hypothetical protein